MGGHNKNSPRKHRDYHSWNSKDLAWGASLGLTDERGRFAIGLSTKAELCDLRVNSEKLGQDFFIQVAVNGEEVRLTMKERASVKGRIVWDDGSPAKDVLVSVSAEVPEPQIPIWYSEPTTLPIRVLDADGNGKKETIGIRTDSKGAFTCKGQRATAMTVRIHGDEGGVKVEGLDGSAGAVDLGQLTLDPKRADKPPAGKSGGRR